jgi:RNA polymerase sigma factor (sigma-70 family)
LFKRYTDSAIIDGIRQQDEKILNWLYDNYLQAVKKYVLNNSGSAEDVSDVFQESIIILYNQITEEKLNLTSELKGYFFGIARIVWNETIRKKQKTIDLEYDIVEEDNSYESDYQTLEILVNRAFQKLDENQKEVLKLSSEGVTYDTIARIMDLKSEGNARKFKYTAKENLIKIMKLDPEYQEYLRHLK